MPLNTTSFTKQSVFAHPKNDLSAIFALKDEHAFDWGFDLDLPYEHLGVFARHMTSAAPIKCLPVFAIAKFNLVGTSLAALDPADKNKVPALAHVPLGVVGTDHVGYGSFDLWPLRHVQVMQSIKNSLADAGLLAAGKKRLTVALSELLVMPYKDPTIAFNALVEGDLGPNTICLRMDIDVVMLAGRAEWPAMPAMQTPGILDWRLSPGSFSMSGALLIGEDGCETLLPGNLSTRLIRFYQPVRTTAEAKATQGRAFRPPDVEMPGFSGTVRLGYAVQYDTEWFHLGHSLGQIAYSMPLAPGERINIAIVDWSRRDLANRTENTTVKEELDHAAVRDRNLTEAVNMVVRESQSGSSFMGGNAGSMGMGMAIGPMSLGAGGAHSFGGATASSDGMRSLVGQTTQNITDAFHQASSALRELNSTVVVQGTQAESAEARTRVIANNNHSHALTILYYEVLQHNRLLTRPVSIRPAIFLKHDAAHFDVSLGGEADYSLVAQYKDIIARNLLDESVRSCLDIVSRWVCLKLNFDREKKRRQEQGDPADQHELGDFTLWVLSGAQRPVFNLYARIIPKAGGTPIDCIFTDPAIVAQTPTYDANGNIGSAPLPTVLENLTSNRIRANEEFLTSCRPTQKIRWGNISAIEIGSTIAPGTHVEFHNAPPPADWVVQKMEFVTKDGADKWTMFSGVPTPSSVKWNGSTRCNVQPFKPLASSVDDLLTDEERCCLSRLITHLNAHRGHYWRAIWLSEIPEDRTVRFDSWQFDGSPLNDVIDNRLLDFSDEYAVFAAAAGTEKILQEAFDLRDLAIPPAMFDQSIEQIITVPARGVFAEAKLGHCNASEIIDPTRFWDWQISPNPDQPPPIAPTSTDSRYQKPDDKLGPTAFPESLINIVAPQVLPDPAGLGAAAGVLSALGPFRDMSGIKELGPLLQTLSNNATQLAAQGLQNAQLPATMNSIRSAKELPPERRADLLDELLTGQVKNQNRPPAPTPMAPDDAKPPPTGTSPTPTPTPAPTPSPTPTPAPTPQPKPQATGPKTRQLLFVFYFDTMAHMPGDYVIELLDKDSGRIYPSNAQSGNTYLYTLAVPSSIKGGVYITIRGPVKPTKFEVIGKIAPEPWTYEIFTSKLFASLENVTGFEVTAAGKSTDVELTFEKEAGAEWTSGTSSESSVVIKGGGGLDKVVEISAEGGYKYTVTNDTVAKQGTKDVRKVKMTVRSLDQSKQPTIKEVK